MLKGSLFIDDRAVYWNYLPDHHFEVYKIIEGDEAVARKVYDKFAATVESAFGATASHAKWGLDNRVTGEPVTAIAPVEDTKSE